MTRQLFYQKHTFKDSKSSQNLWIVLLLLICGTFRAADTNHGTHGSQKELYERTLEENHEANQVPTNLHHHNSNSISDMLSGKHYLGERVFPKKKTLHAMVKRAASTSNFKYIGLGRKRGGLDVTEDLGYLDSSPMFLSRPSVRSALLKWTGLGRRKKAAPPFFAAGGGSEDSDVGFNNINNRGALLYKWSGLGKRTYPIYLYNPFDADNGPGDNDANLNRNSRNYYTNDGDDIYYYE